MSRVELIEHPGAALMVPFLTKEKMIFLRQYRAVLEKYLYELPAGTLENKEKALTCAKRELIEETGYAAKKMTKLGRIYPVPGYSTEVIYIYKAEGLTAQSGLKDIDEIIQVRIFTRQEVQNLFHRKKIIDAKTICALAFCGWI